MRRRDASINAYKIEAADRRILQIGVDGEGMT